MNYQRVKDLKTDLEELRDFYILSSSKNKSFERINILRLVVDTHFWSIDRSPPDESDDKNYKLFFIMNNHMSRYILANLDIYKLEYVAPLKRFDIDKRERIKFLINKIILNWIELTRIYPVIELTESKSLNIIINKKCQNSIPEMWKKWKK